MSTAAVFLHNRESLRQKLAFWPTTSTVRIRICDFFKLIVSFLTDSGRMEIFYAKKNNGRGASRFRPFLNIAQSRGAAV
jgi:hypothetical protein